MTTEAYEDYLKSDRWRENRAGALARAGDRCQVCNGTDHLEVHHRTYERLGNERPEDMTVLCGDCHELFHERKKAIEAEKITTALGALYNRIDEKSAGDTVEMSGLPTGYADLDALTAGCHGGQLIVVASSPGVGKSTFLLNLARSMDVPALYISPEHGPIDVAHRLLVAEAGVDGNALGRGALTTAMMQQLIDAGQRIKTRQLYLDPTPSPSILRVAAVSHKTKSAHAIQVVFIDSLELLQSGVTGYRPEQIAVIARGLKALARELDLPVIVTTRLGAAPDRQDQHPRLSDFGAHFVIPQEADTVLLLHEPDRFESAGSKNRLELIVAKQRNGPTGEIDLEFNKPCFRIDGIPVTEGFAP